MCNFCNGLEIKRFGIRGNIYIDKVDNRYYLNAADMSIVIDYCPLCGYKFE